MEIMQPLHALSVHREMELLGVMVIVYGLINNVFQKVRLKVPSLNLQIRLDIDPVTLFSSRKFQIVVKTFHYYSSSPASKDEG